MDILTAVKALAPKGPGVTILISDFFQEAFLEEQSEVLTQILRFLNYRRQKTVLLQVLAGEELNVNLTGTLNLIDMEDKSTLRVTMDAAGIQTYDKVLKEFTGRLQRESAKAGAVYALCNTDRDFYQMMFSDLRMLYDI